MTVNSKLSQVFTYQSLVHAISGAAGGCIAMSTFYPLDTVRSRLQLEDNNSEVRSTLQVIKEIVLGEGFWALYRGLGPVLQSLSISNFVYFYTFHTLKAIAASKPGADQTALKDLFLGALAGIVNVLITTPFWVVNTRLRMRNVIGTSDDVDKNYKTLLGGLQYVHSHEGWRALWSGTLPSLMLVSNPALQFMMYEMLKRNIINFTGQEISSRGYFLIGAIAKAFATLITYPLQLVQTKLRHRSKIAATSASTSANAKSSHKNFGMLDILFGIIKQQGFRGLFRGLEAKILQTVLTAALMFTAYEKIAQSVRLLLIP